MTEEKEGLHFGQYIMLSLLERERSLRRMEEDYKKSQREAYEGREGWVVDIMKDINQEEEDE